MRRTQTQRVEDVRQRILRCLWFDQGFVKPAGQPFKLDDGRTLRVFSPGWWNLETGPDFRNACFRFGSEPVLKGSVEVHLRASEWEGRGHNKNVEYNSVVLHLCLWNDTGKGSVTTAAGATIPQLTVEPYLSEESIADFREAAERVA